MRRCLRRRFCRYRRLIRCARGWGSRAGWIRALSEAPFFYWLYTLLIVLGAAVVLMPNFPLVKLIILSQVLNGVLLPVVHDLDAAADQQA